MAYSLNRYSLGVPVGRQWNRFAKICAHPGWLAVWLWLGFAGFVLLRLAAHGWDPSAFVCAGTPACDPAATPASLLVHTDGASYDGQFYYRMALAPGDLRATAHGIRMEVPAYRQMRIGYPLVCRLFSLAQPAWLPAAMIGVNLFWLAVLMLVGLCWCRDLGLAAGWGLLPLLWPGFLMTLGRDLTEIQAVALLVSGVWLAGRGRPGWAALAFSGAVLTRETALLPLAGFGLYWCVRGGREKSWASWRQAAWLLVPAAVMLAWHGFLRGQHGVWPVLSLAGGGSAIGAVPFAGLLHFIAAGLPFDSLHRSAMTNLLPPEGVERLYQLYALLLLGLCVAVPVLTASALRSSLAPAPVKIGWALLALLFFAQNQANWALGPSAYLRLGNDVAAFGLLVIVWNGPVLRRVALGLLAAGWLAAWPYCIAMP